MSDSGHRSSSNPRTELRGPHTYEDNSPRLEPIFRGDIDYLIRMVRMRQIRAIELVLKPFGPNVSAWLPLVVLQRLHGLSQRDLGNRLDIRDAAIGKAIEAMEKAGVVERFADPADKRKALVRLTETGKLLAEEISAKREEFLAAIVVGFSKDEEAKLHELLERAFANIVDFIDIRDRAD